MAFKAPRVLRRIAALFTWSRRDRDMQQEMAFHLDSLTRGYVRSGMTDAEAERAARQRFGSVLRTKEHGHDVRSTRLVEDLLRDVRYAARGLRRTPGFAAVAVLTCALGIGGNTAIFSVVDQLLLRPLPYPDGDRLVVVYETFRGDNRVPASPANWLDWQQQARSLSGIAAWMSMSTTLTDAGEPERVNAQAVSWEFFEVLGVAPALGRAIGAEDDFPDAPPVAVLSHGLWQRRFGSDPGVIGRTIRFDDTPTRVIGVMPEGFRFIASDTAYWTPFRLGRTVPWREVAGRFTSLVARRRADVSFTAAQQELETITSRLAASFTFNRNFGVRLVPLREELTGQVQASLVVLYASVGVLLAIACFNVANLLLARAAARTREIAVRTSLGAGRAAIVRQLLVESVVLALAGGVLGIGLARWSLDAIVAFAPAELLGVPDLYVDRRVLIYAFVLSALTGIVAGLAPAVSVIRRSLASRLSDSGTRVTHSPRLRQALVVTQVAMTVVLLCGAGLLVRTLVALSRTHTGVDTANVLTMDVGLPRERYTPGRRAEFFRQAVERLRGLPGVEAAAAANSLPVVGRARAITTFQRLGAAELAPNDRPSTVVRVVTPGYFRAVGTPIARGRDFSDSDQAAGATPGFIVNEAFVRQFVSDTDPLTVSLSIAMQLPPIPYWPIIGVAADVSERSLREPARPTVFYSHGQMPETAMTFFIRTAQPAAVTAPAVAALRAIDPNLAVTKVRTIETAFADSIARERLNALVSGGFAVSGLALASLGLYGLLAYLVAERTKEFGIRIVLGARAPGLIASVVGRGFRLVAIGTAVGLPAALLLSRAAAPLLYGVTPYDVGTYASVVALLLVVAAWASLIPARRAARVEPLLALRQD